MSPTRIQFIESALAYLRANRFEETSDICRKLLAADRNDLDARFLLGVALSARGLYGEAEHHLSKVVARRPDHLDAHRELAKLLEASGKLAEAEIEYREVIKIVPRDAGARCLLANCLIATGQIAKAAQETDEVLRIAPAFAPAHNLLAVVLCEQGRMIEAIDKFRKTILLDGSYVSALANLGGALAAQGEFDPALAVLTDAMFHAPSEIYVRLKHAHALLKSGRLAEGFSELEWRRRAPARDALPAAMLLPRLDQLGGVAGKTILIHHEQGFGDTLQFLRYAPLLSAAGARVALWMPEELARLLRAQPGLGELYIGTVTLPRFDYHCPMLSLPRAFGTTLATIPAGAPYLQADPALAWSWAGRLPPPGRCRVGLVWAGEPKPGDPGAAALERKRSIGLQTLAPILGLPGADFVSLQRGPAQHQAEAFIRAGLISDPMWGVTDFADTAAIIANLDVVVSIDTSVAHLAGAMGKPVLLVDRYDNCWRWLAGRADSPWYPTMRIFRQHMPGDWDSVAGWAAASLNDFIARLAAAKSAARESAAGGG